MHRTRPDSVMFRSGHTSARSSSFSTTPAVVAREAHEHIHQLRAHPQRRLAGRQSIQGGLGEPLADPEIEDALRRRPLEL